MKTITKYKIINWHYFWNETIDIKPIAFLTGVNGSGKSTLIDGMLLLLLGDTTGKFFNKAAMEKSNRTLKGYLRGEIGDTEDGGYKYLRDGRFTSYLVLEIYDDIHDSYFCMGCVFDSFEDGSDEHRFFLLEDKLPENEFIVDNIPLSYKKLNEYLSENYKDKYKFFDSNKSYQETLKRVFGGLKDKYFSLLKKATSFSPITDITTFITEYVCDEQENVDLDAMQQNIFQYKSLESEANQMELRIGKLNEIEDLYYKYLQTQQDIKLCSYIIEKIECQISQDRIYNYKTQVESFNKRLNEIDLELKENEANKDELSRKKVDLIKSKANNDVYKITSDLLDEKKELEDKIKELNSLKNVISSNINNYANSFMSMANTLSLNLESLDLNLFDEDKANEIRELKENADYVIDESKSLLEQLKSGINYIREDNLKSWRTAVISFKNLISAFCVSFAKTIRNLENKLSSYKHDLESMKIGVKPYEQSLTSIKRELENQLQLKYNKKIEVNIFADLIDIDDKSWSNAIEAFMHNQKFNLFIEPKYYFDAYKILKVLLEKYHYYGTSLVDQEKIINANFKAENGSLAEEIISDHEGAIAYTNFLIGRLYKCQNIEEARDSLNGITKDCDLYRNYTLSKINPKLYRESYIGRNIGAKEIEAKQREINALSEQIVSFKQLFNLVNQINTLEVINTNEINSTLEDIKSLHEVKGLESSLDYINSELSKHDTLEISSLDKRIDAIDEDIKLLDKELTDLNIEKGNLINSIKVLKEEKIINEQSILDERNSRLLNNFSATFISETALPVFEKELEENAKLIEINTKYQSLLSRAQYLAANLFGQIKKIRREYVNDYHLSYDIEKEVNDDFNNELINIRDIQLPLYKQKIQDAYNKASKQFKDDFISKLRNQIESVETQINELNDALASSTFGDDSYSFTCKPNPVYKRYYDMFKDDLLLSCGEDESEFILKYEDVMADLFNQITTIETSNKSTELLSNVEKFTDYRTYLDFDLIVTNKEGNKQRLSKMIKKKSGGETQTPFYIAVLASFAQLYHVNQKGELGNSIRLIVFDEAFSKMDRARIRESVKLLRKFNLQALISAPSEKVGDISELVDETLVVLKSKKSSVVRLYAKDM